MTETGDLGIVLYLRGPNSTDAPTYYDRKGKLQTTAALGVGFAAMPLAVDTAHPYCSAAAATSMFVIVTGLTGGESPETVTVRCRQAYRPEPNPGPAADPHFAGPPLVYFDTLWVLQEPATAANKEFAFTANGAYLIQTASDLLGDILEFSAKSSTESSAASVMVAAKVGS